MKLPTKPKALISLMLDASSPISTRLEYLKLVAHSGDETAEAILGNVLEAAASAKTDEQAKEKLLELAAMVQALQEGPLRCALFDQMIDQPGIGPRAQVIMPDGSLALAVVPDAALVEKMACGDTVWVESKGTAILFHAAAEQAVGEEATLERVHEDGFVSVSTAGDNRSLYRPTARLRAQIERGEAKAGATIVVCPRRMVAFMALPEADGLEHYQFLSREPVPDVEIERDLGSPPPFVTKLIDHVRRELADPDVGRSYRMRPSKLTLLSGIPGSGKTHSINALWNAIAQVASEATGAPVEDLPPRAMRLKSSEVLSKWFGEADRRIARFFKEVDQLAAEPFVAPDGREWKLPVLVIAEEIDALARSRGQDSIHDRIMATLLEGFDPSRPVFRDHIVIVVATTNTPELVDWAMIRRIGGRIEKFGHMKRADFRSVLEKLLRDLPFRETPYQDGRAAREQAIDDTTAWLYAANSSAGGQVELTMVGQANATTRYHRHFLTAGLVDRAVQDACEEAANAEYAGTDHPGLTTAAVTTAIHRQVRHIVDLLTPHNCEKYLDLPDGERVATVRRIEQPAVLPIQLMSQPEPELERAS